MEYSETAGLKMFRCEPLHMCLSQRGCGDRWRLAQEADGYNAEGLAACRGCSIGASHAGETHVVFSALYGEKICPRCRRGATRIIHNRCCVSCYNRARELKAGANARGNPPVELMERPLRKVRFRMSIDGVIEDVSYGPAIDLQEAIIQMTRTRRGRLEFGFSRPAAPSQKIQH